MSDSLRALLYLPLGLLPSLFFSMRMLVLWIASERAGRSVSPRLFWQLSLAGNAFQMVHYIVQMQFPFALIQAVTAVIAWRNLDLMQKKRAPKAFSTVIAFEIAATLFVLLFFLFFSPKWMATPLFEQQTSLVWHLMGCLGGFLFAARFWVQWWFAEKKQTSEIGASFFWLSLIGSLLSLVYFVRIHDWISFAQYGSGLIPYLRSLMLIRKQKAPEASPP